MGKLKNIIEGYKNLIWEDQVLKPLFDQRMNTCNSCENNKLGICILCGCVLKAKTKAPLEDCPAQFWKPIFYIDNDFQYVLRSEMPIELQEHFSQEEVPLDEWQGFLVMHHIEEEE